MMEMTLAVDKWGVVSFDDRTLLWWQIDKWIDILITLYSAKIQEMDDFNATDMKDFHDCVGVIEAERVWHFTL